MKPLLNIARADEEMREKAEEVIQDFLLNTGMKNKRNNEKRMNIFSLFEYCSGTDLVIDWGTWIQKLIKWLSTFFSLFLLRRR